MGFQCFVYQVSHKRSYQSTGSYIQAFRVLSTRCHSKGPINLQVLIYGLLLYCLPGVTQNVLPINRFLYTCFYCIVYQVSQKRSYQSTGSYTQVLSVLSTRCHTKCPTNLLVLIHVLLLHCLPGVTKKVLPIYRFLCTGFLCIVCHVSNKRSYQSTGFYIWVFTALSTRCPTKLPTNLQVLIQGFVLYCLQGVIQQVLPIYRFLQTGFQCIVYQVSHKRSYESTGSYIWVFSLLSTKCHTKGPTNLQVLIYGFLLYCLPGFTEKVLPIYRFLYTGFQCIVYKVSHKRSYQSHGTYIRFLVYYLPGVTQKVLKIYRFLYTCFYHIVFQVSHKKSYQSTGSYIRVFSVLSTRCHTKCPTNLQVLIYGFLMYCLPGVTQKVLPIYRFLYPGFQCIVLQVSHKRSYQSTGSYIWVFSVLPTRCHTKGPTNQQVLIYGFLLYCVPGVTQKILPIYRFLYTGFQCIVYQVSHKSSYQSTGSYIRVFSVLSTRCHSKGPTNLQVPIYRFLLYCLQGVTQNVLPIYSFLYTCFYCIVYQVSQKRSYQSTGSYIQVFSVLSSRCQRKGPTNLQVLIYGYLLYCLPGVTQKDLPIYMFIYRGFYCIVYKVSYKRSYQSTGS